MYLAALALWPLFICSQVFGLNQTNQQEDTPPCKKPYGLSNGSVTVFGNQMLVEYRCDPGLFPIGRTFGSCNVERRFWSIKPPYCVAATCEPPKDLDNGRYIFSHEGAVATAVCNARYRRLGSMTIYCDGYAWRGYRPRCREKYPATGVKRQIENATVAADPEKEKADQQLQKDIEDADNTCYQSYTKAPDVEHATWKVGYKYNTVTRVWVLFANYTCEEGFKFGNKYQSYLYCKNYQWISEAMPNCVEDKPVSEPCKDNNGGCDHICVPHQHGRFSCQCEDGYVLGSFLKSCEDIDECTINNGGCAHECHNIPASYFCRCDRGYVLADGHTCLDIDECLTPGAQQCTYECINIPGSYECTCNISGFTQSRDRKSCVDINECLADNGGCEDTCTNTHGSFRCGCARVGYTLSADGRTCQDLDECSRYGRLRCRHGNCENLPGSFRCHCHPGFQVTKSGKKCRDIDECADYNGGCQEKCINTQGHYHCDCHDDGYILGPDNTTCVDRNECEQNNGGCQDVCINEDGRYKCACQGHLVVAEDGHTCTYCDGMSYYDNETEMCVSCPPNSSVQNSTFGSSVDDCKCNEGYLPGDNVSFSCEDIDECAEGLLVCDHECVNTNGSANCACQEGYRLLNNTQCIDIDECLEATATCTDMCVNTPGSFRCSCGSNSRLNIDQVTCDDIDECYEGLLNCSHECVDIDGGAFCACPRGYTLQVDNSTCRDVDECSIGTHVCQDECTNIPGGYTCYCKEPGLKLSWDGASCVDINECMEGDNQCSDVCLNTHGSYTCRCDADGYMLSSDGHTCVDDDECADEDRNNCEQRCINLDGSYRCDCRAGHSLVSFSDCAPCGWDSYRTLESAECVPCPPHSRTLAVARTHVSECICNRGYQRDIGNSTTGGHCVRI